MTNEEICAAISNLADRITASAETTEGKLIGASLYKVCGSLAGGSAHELSEIVSQHSMNELTRLRGMKN